MALATPDPSLVASGFNPVRWKIEDTLLDSKHGDEL